MEPIKRPEISRTSFNFFPGRRALLLEIVAKMKKENPRYDQTYAINDAIEQMHKRLK